MRAQLLQAASRRSRRSRGIRPAAGTPPAPPGLRGGSGRGRGPRSPAPRARSPLKPAASRRAGAAAAASSRTRSSSSARKAGLAPLLLDQPHQRAPHHHAVGDLAHRRDLLRGRDAEAHGERLVEPLAQPLDVAREIGRQGGALAGDPGARDVVDEAGRGLGHLGHPVAGAGGGEQKDGVHPLLAQRRDELPLPLLRRQVDAEHAVDAGGGRLLGEALDAAGVDRVEVGEEDDRHAELVAVPGHELQDARHLGARGERPRRRPAG